MGQFCFERPMRESNSLDGRGAIRATGYLGILDFGFSSEWLHGLCTLFPEYFSTFPRGTCSLSVLWVYLALGGIYHPT